MTLALAKHYPPEYHSQRFVPYDTLDKIPVKPPHFRYAYRDYLYSNHSFAECLGYADMWSDSGLSLAMLTGETVAELAAVDIDNCIRYGEVVPEARPIINCQNSRIEFSQTAVRNNFRRGGLKVIGKGNFEGLQKVYGENRVGWKNGRVEFLGNRQITGLTGVLYDTRKIVIDSLNINLPFVIPALDIPRDYVYNPSVNRAIENLIDEIASNRIVGGIFRKLFEGDCSDYDNDHSRADLAFNRLVIWNAKDEECLTEIYGDIMDFDVKKLACCVCNSVMLKSKLFRPKWLRDVYRIPTLEMAWHSTGARNKREFHSDAQRENQKLSVPSRTGKVANKVVGAKAELSRQGVEVSNNRIAIETGLHRNTVARYNKPKENNHTKRRKARHKIIECVVKLKRHGVIKPSQNRVAKETGLSRQTVRKHYIPKVVHTA